MVERLDDKTIDIIVESVSREDKIDTLPLPQNLKTIIRDKVKIRSFIKMNDDRRVTSFHDYIYNKDDEKIELILKYYPEMIHARCDSAYTALHVACEFGSLSSVKKFVKNGADVNVQDYLGITPLSLAVLAHHNNIVEYLLEQDKVDIERESNLGYTALMFSVDTYNIDITMLLIRGGANVFHTNNNGESILERAMDQRNGDMINILLMAGAYV